jgi:hypothetical protein
MLMDSTPKLVPAQAMQFGSLAVPKLSIRCLRAERISSIFRPFHRKALHGDVKVADSLFQIFFK